MTYRSYSFVDQLVITLDNGLKTLTQSLIASRPNPAEHEPEGTLSLKERKQSGALMRINHTGEVCAQALYYGQTLVARSDQTKQALLQAAQEEIDHLAWCQQRLQELQAHPSYLNPLWYLGAFSLGLLAGSIGDQWSLGFVLETERQVEEHLESHLQTLPKEDTRSYVIIKKMAAEEANHATVAIRKGATELPNFIKFLMNGLSKIMTTTTYYF